MNEECWYENRSKSCKGDRSCSGWKTLVDYFEWNVEMESGPKQRIYDHEKKG